MAGSSPATTSLVQFGARAGMVPFRFASRREDFLTNDRYVRSNRGRLTKPPREVTRTETRRLNPAGFSVGKVVDVTLLSKKLCASRRAVAGPQGSRRPAGESHPGTGRVDRGHRCQSEEDEQVGLTKGWPSGGAFILPLDGHFHHFAARLAGWVERQRYPSTSPRAIDGFRAITTGLAVRSRARSLQIPISRGGPIFLLWPAKSFPRHSCCNNPEQIFPIERSRSLERTSSAFPPLSLRACWKRTIRAYTP